MIKLEVTYEFSLQRFNELKNIVRKDNEKNEKGFLHIGDTFECSKDLAKYLTGNNDNKLVVAKILEVIPEKEEQKKVEATEKATEKATETTKRKSKKSKK